MSMLGQTARNAVEAARAKVDHLTAAERLWSEIRQATLQELAAARAWLAADRAAGCEVVGLEAELATAERMLLKARRSRAEAQRALWRAEAAACYEAAARLLLMAERANASAGRAPARWRQRAAWSMVEAAELEARLAAADCPAGAADHLAGIRTPERAVAAMLGSAAVPALAG